MLLWKWRRIRHQGAGPDGFPAEFYQKIWDIIKIDLMAMFHAFQRHDLPLFHLNFGMVILLPKKRKHHSDPTI
jgi:hypothetical protein